MGRSGLKMPELSDEGKTVLAKLNAIKDAREGGDDFDEAVRQLLKYLEAESATVYDHAFCRAYVKNLVKKYIADKGGEANRIGADFILLSFGLLPGYDGSKIVDARRRYAEKIVKDNNGNHPTWMRNASPQSFRQHEAALLAQLAADIDCAIKNGKWVSLLDADLPQNSLPVKDQPDEKTSGSDGADKASEPPNKAALPPAGDKPQSKPPTADAPQESPVPQAESPADEAPQESSDPQQNPPERSDEAVSPPSDAGPQQAPPVITTPQELPGPQVEPEAPPSQKRRGVRVQMRKKPLLQILRDKRHRIILLASTGAVILLTVLLSIALMKDARPTPEAPAYRVEWSIVKGGDDAILDVQLSDASYDSETSPLDALEIQAEDGKEYAIRIQLVSPNPNGVDSARVAFQIPTETSNAINVLCGFFYTNNDSGTPDYRVGEIMLRAENLFHLEYVPGSAKLYNGGIGIIGYTLPDSITAEGALVGYDKIDGIIPGGDGYVGYVSIRVKVVSDTVFEVKQRIRHQGDQEWRESVEAAVGDRLEIAIKYENTSEIDETQRNIIVRAVLPDGLAYVPGSVWLDEGNTSLYNSNHPDGATFENDGSIFGSGVNIGHSKPKGYAYVTILVEVVDNYLMPGKNELVCWGQCSVGGTTHQDSCSVLVQK